MNKPQTKIIYSENNDFQYIETLRRNREKRSKNKEFFIEGVRPINQAIKYDWNIIAFGYARDKKLSSWAQNILKKSSAKIHYELPFKLLEKLSNKEETSELIAIVGMKDDDLARIPLKDNPLILIFDRPSSPGNLGTLIRSSDALGVDGIIITGHAVDLYDPEVISASTGSFFALPIIRKPSHNDLVAWIAEIKKDYKDLQIVGTDEKGSETIDEHDFKKQTLLLVGNETVGLSKAYRTMCHSMVNIPMYGSATSLNVACASSIVLYEIDRQRRAAK
jgi:23S rRNA (uridine2479-2'-O)-methyltransferase